MIGMLLLYPISIGLTTHSEKGICYSLTSVTVPSGVTSLEDYVFYICASLTDISITESVTFIGSMAFYECDKLADVYYAGSESQWGQISIDNSENGNDPLLNATVHYNS